MSKDKRIITRKELLDNYYRIIQQIQARAFVLQPEYILAVNRGGLDLGLHLSHALNIPLETVNWPSVDAHKRDVDQLQAILRRHDDEIVLIVDEICDTGSTLAALVAVMSMLESNLSMLIAVSYMHSSVKHIPYDDTSSIVPIVGEYLHDDRYLVFPWENWQDSQVFDGQTAPCK